MTSGGTDVKLIFWEIACPGKARFRERWTQHQSRVTTGVSRHRRRTTSETPHDIAHQSVPFEYQSNPAGRETAPPTPFFGG